MVLNRDTGELGLISIYDNLLKSDRVNFNSPNVINVCPSASSIHANEPDPRRSETRFHYCFGKNRIIKQYVESKTVQNRDDTFLLTVNRYKII